MTRDATPRPVAPRDPPAEGQLPPRGSARTRMLRALARLLWAQEQAEQRLRRLREVER